eukprot:TRINITY_DN30383_c0_g1_i1.p1 TRINITY_DN30383_c0_g1~~TRINITY_DN30383_c0_g1_i1.p1  ORF type:complete len:574 (-),score=72.68 TRINITY_DN30383_c0_g1_i1:340-1977(-)
MATWWLLCSMPLLAASRPLLLTPLIESGDLEKAREASRIVIDDRYMGHSGYFSVPSASGRNVNNLFTWFQPCLDGCHPGETPLIQWFNGGPGSPDTIGAMNQIGNWYVDEDLQLKDRCFSWCKRNNCLFVDSPVMTGFSYQVDLEGNFNETNIEYTQWSQDATAQVLEVLHQFLKLWPEYASAPYYVQGLSYGGMYVPAMAENILKHNEHAKKNARPLLNFKGIAVGDPVMDNKYQYATHPSTLYAMGLVMEDERAIIEAIVANVSKLNDVDCLSAFREWNRIWNDDGGSSCDPSCDFLFKAFTGSSNTEHLLLGAQPEHFEHFKRYFARHAAEFHIDGCPNLHVRLGEGGEVYLAMVKSGDYCTASSPLYTTLFLTHKLDVIVYASNLDLLLGPPATAAGIQAAWDYAEHHLAGGAEAKRAYYSQSKSIWRVEAADINPAGYAKCLDQDGGSSRFCYVVVRNAGHETAPYAPRAAYDLNERFLRRAPFDSETRIVDTPVCAACGGAPPLAGDALPACKSVPSPIESSFVYKGNGAGSPLSVVTM